MGEGDVGPPGCADITRKCVPHGLGMLFVHVDLILRTVEPETDGPLGGTAVKVIDE